jgi:hypothetical protein
VAVAAPVFAGALSVLMYALVAAVPDISLKSGFLLVGFGANLLVAGFAWIGERQRRRKRNQLGSFIQRALQLRRDCLSPVGGAPRPAIPEFCTGAGVLFDPRLGPFGASLSCLLVL